MEPDKVNIIWLPRPSLKGILNKGSLTKIIKYLSGFHKKSRIGNRKHKIKTDPGGVFALFAGLTDTYQPAISSFFNFFFFRQKRNKKKQKSFLRNRATDFSYNYALKAIKLISFTSFVWFKRDFFCRILNLCYLFVLNDWVKRKQAAEK